MRSLSSEKAEKKKKPILKILALSSILLAATIGIFIWLGIGKKVVEAPQSVVQLITDSGLKSEDGRTNILLLGIGGVGHDGPDLTDTIIIASVDKEGKDVALISIPRDLWIPTTQAKVNHIYAYGQENDEQGLENAKEQISGLLSIPLHYAFRIDFGGFTKAVDLVGGLDLEVENSFSDPKYPLVGKEDDLCGLKIETEEKDGQKREVVKDATGSAIPLNEITDENDPFICRYETITFRKGNSRMDGKTALKFVRSRHGTNGEGSDFARSARQQKVLLSFRQQVLSTDTLLNPKKIIELAKTFGASIDTDIQEDEIPLFTKLATKVDSTSVRRIVLDANPQTGALEFGSPADYNGQSVLVPKEGDWQKLSNFIKGEIFKYSEGKSDSSESKPQEAFMN
ncbi:LCP family protein [Candidatus Curtissbacteria bacterium]|nr:LCP family protein [Candidatus Curtissbacteria bacterium]